MQCLSQYEVSKASFHYYELAKGGLYENITGFNLISIN